MKHTHTRTLARREREKNEKERYLRRRQSKRVWCGRVRHRRAAKSKCQWAEHLVLSFFFCCCCLYFAKRFAQSTRCYTRICACEYLCVSVRVRVFVCVNALVCWCCACVLATVERDVNIGRKTGSFRAWTFLISLIIVISVYKSKQICA